MIAAYDASVYNAVVSFCTVNNNGAKHTDTTPFAISTDLCWAMLAIEKSNNPRSSAHAAMTGIRSSPVSSGWRNAQIPAAIMANPALNAGHQRVIAPVNVPRMPSQNA